MTIVNTNIYQLPLIEIDEESRVLKFEYGSQLVEFSYLLSAEISLPIFLGNLTDAVAQGRFSEFLSESINTILQPEENTPELTAPMLLALSSPIANNPDASFATVGSGVNENLSGPEVE